MVLIVMVYFRLVNRRNTRPYAAGVAAYSRALSRRQSNHAPSVASSVIRNHDIARVDRRARAESAFSARGARAGLSARWA